MISLTCNTKSEFKEKNIDDNDLFIIAKLKEITNLFLVNRKIKAVRFRGKFRHSYFPLYGLMNYNDEIFQVSEGNQRLEGKILRLILRNVQWQVELCGETSLCRLIRRESSFRSTVYESCFKEHTASVSANLT